MSISPTRFAFTLAIVGCAAACGSSSDAPTDAATGDAAAVDAPPVPPDVAPVDPACLAPITIPPDPNAEAAAAAELQALDPTATFEWDAVRGTFRSITGLVIPLPDCTGNDNAFDELFKVLEQSPALFQIDRAEWTTNVLPCSQILASGYESLTIRRTKYGPFALDNDVFTAIGGVQNGNVILHFFSGTYVPKPNPAVVAKLQSCPDRSHDALATELRVQPFDYVEYMPQPVPPCTPEGDATYTAATEDTLTFDPTIITRWDETDVLTLRRLATATLRVAEANYTPALLNSSANCPDEAGNSRVGWIRMYNAITGELIYDQANPDPFCTVCLQ